jgi:hypothetical protein
MARKQATRDPRIKALSDDFLDCRQRHDWNGERYLHRWRYKDGTETLQISTQCVRCKSTQIREVITYSRKGHLIPGFAYRQTRIEYAPGYKIQLGEDEDRPARYTFVLEQARRFLERYPDVPISDRE